MPPNDIHDTPGYAMSPARMHRELREHADCRPEDCDFTLFCHRYLGAVGHLHNRDSPEQCSICRSDRA
jgi:hypothetical protein